MSVHVRIDAPALRAAVVSLLGTKTYAAIGSDLGISKSAVCGIVHRAGLSKPKPMSAKARSADYRLSKLYLINLAEGLARRPSLYITHPDARP